MSGTLALTRLQLVGPAKVTYTELQLQLLFFNVNYMNLTATIPSHWYSALHRDISIYERLQPNEVLRNISCAFVALISRTQVCNHGKSLASRDRLLLTLFQATTAPPIYPFERRVNDAQLSKSYVTPIILAKCHQRCTYDKWESL